MVKSMKAYTVSILAGALIAPLILCPWTEARPKAIQSNKLIAMRAPARPAPVTPPASVPKLPAGGAVLEMSKASVSEKEALNPLSGAWASAPAASVPLQAQKIVTPHGGGSVPALSVKSLHLDNGIAFHFEWSDESKDNDTVHQVKFRDAVAIEFPVGSSKDTVLSMGCPHGPVNIWHWKADWEPDAPRMNDLPYTANPDWPRPSAKDNLIYSRLHVDSDLEPNAAQGLGGPSSKVYTLFPQNAHKSPVEDIVAIGVSSVSTKPERFQVLKGRGVWQDKKWHVVIFKPFGLDDPAAPQFKAGESMNVAFAVWNGSKQDRNGQKSISNWATLKCR